MNRRLYKLHETYGKHSFSGKIHYNGSISMLECSCGKMECFIDGHGSEPLAAIWVAVAASGLVDGVVKQKILNHFKLVGAPGGGHGNEKKPG